MRPIPDDLVCTGHIASIDGDLRVVRRIDAKVRAAVADPTVRRFVHPKLDLDASLALLSPVEAERAAHAIAQARLSLSCAGVNDVGELMQHAFEEEQVVLASLRSGYFDMPCSALGEPSNPTAAVLQYLTQDLEQRFNASVERHLIAGDSIAATRMLSARAAHQVRERRYPPGFGRWLFELLSALPPAVRRLQTSFPLMPMDDCVRLSQLAPEAEYDDVRLLYDATLGKIADIPAPRPPVTAECDDEIADAGLRVVLEQIAPEYLASHIGLPIDAARATFVTNSVTVESDGAFHELIASFYLHLLRHTRSVPPGIASRDAFGDALELLNSSHAQRGGYKAARAEGRDGTHGGMRAVFDLMTEHYKAKEQAKHVDAVLKKALDDLDWNEKVAFLTALHRLMRPHLPADLAAEPPERYATHFEVIVRAYVQSISRVRDLIRTL